MYWTPTNIFVNQFRSTPGVLITGESKLPGGEYTGESRLLNGKYTGKSWLSSGEYTEELITIKNNSHDYSAEYEIVF